MITKVTSNGRVTVPKRVRDYLGIAPGTEVVFRRAPTVASSSNGLTERDRRPIGQMVGSAGPGPSTDEIMAMLRGNDS